MPVAGARGIFTEPEPSQTTPGRLHSSLEGRIVKVGIATGSVEDRGRVLLGFLEVPLL